VSISATELGQNPYKILDENINTGTPVAINRKAQLLKIVPEKSVTIFDLLLFHLTGS